MPRPPKEIDMNQLAAFLRVRPDKSDCASFFQCSEDTIERRIKEHTGLTFKEYRDEQFIHTKMTLMQEALLRAKKSDTILIFCLKNYCQWSDKAPGEGPDVQVNAQLNQLNVLPPKEQILELIELSKDKVK